MAEYTVVMRGPSAAVFYPNQRLVLNDVQTPFGPAQVTYRTRSVKAGKVPIFGDLWVEVKGEAPSWEEGIEPLANAGLLALPIIAFATNAAVRHPDIELAFDSSPGVNQRQFFQSYLPLERAIPHSWRLIDLRNTLAILEALKGHGRFDRLFRAANQYSLALEHWKKGDATMAVAHLWMAVEVMTRVALETQLAQRGLRTNQELADALGIEIKQLDGTLRKEIIFQGDADCYAKTLNASDGMEHGFTGYDELQAKAEQIRVAAARYVRKAILVLIGVSDEAIASMLSPRFLDPIGQGPLVKYFFGILEGGGQKLGVEDCEYPFLRWNPQITSCQVRGEGKIDIGIDDQFTASLGEGITFKPSRTEIWRPG